MHHFRALSVLAAAQLFACSSGNVNASVVLSDAGDATSLPTAETGVDSSAIEDTGAAALTCPSVAPAEGSTCAPRDVACQYGTN